LRGCGWFGRSVLGYYGSLGQLRGKEGQAEQGKNRFRGKGGHICGQSKIIDWFVMLWML
jgi:hypothetical protein